MRLLLMVALLAGLYGCAAVKINPQVSGNSMILTPVNGATAELIISQSLQGQVEKTNPQGKKWGSVSTEVSTGQAVSKSLSSFLRASVPGARVGDRSDLGASTFKIELEKIGLRFGTSDSRASTAGAFIPVLLFTMDAGVFSEVNLSARVSYCGGPEIPVASTGRAREEMNYSAIGFPELEASIAAAIDAASKGLISKITSSPELLRCQGIAAKKQ